MTDLQSLEYLEKHLGEIASLSISPNGIPFICIDPVYADDDPTLYKILLNFINERK